MRSKLLVGTVCLAMMGTAAPLWAKTFSNKNLKGTYAEKFSGFTGSTSNPFPTSSSLPQSGTGLEIADGKGNFTASLVFSIGGLACSGKVKGTYQVNSDGLEPRLEPSRRIRRRRPESPPATTPVLSRLPAFRMRLLRS